jgi:hypothetical protein
MTGQIIAIDSARYLQVMRATKFRIRQAILLNT